MSDYEDSNEELDISKIGSLFSEEIEDDVAVSTRIFEMSTPTEELSSDEENTGIGGLFADDMDVVYSSDSDEDDDEYYFFQSNDIWLNENDRKRLDEVFDSSFRELVSSPILRIPEIRDLSFHDENQTYRYVNCWNYYKKTDRIIDCPISINVDEEELMKYIIGYRSSKEILSKLDICDIRDWFVFFSLVGDRQRMYLLCDHIKGIYVKRDPMGFVNDIKESEIFFQEFILRMGEVEASSKKRQSSKSSNKKSKKKKKKKKKKIRSYENNGFLYSLYYVFDRLIYSLDRKKRDSFRNFDGIHTTLQSFRTTKLSLQDVLHVSPLRMFRVIYNEMNGLLLSNNQGMFDLESSSKTPKSKAKTTEFQNFNVVLKNRDGKNFNTHLEILLIKSSFFQLMLRFQGLEFEEWKEHGAITITEIIDSKILSLLLKFYYTGRMFKKDESFRISDYVYIFFHLLNFSDKFINDDLFRYCLTMSLKSEIVGNLPRLISKYGYIIESHNVKERLIEEWGIRDKSKDVEWFNRAFRESERKNNYQKTLMKVLTEHNERIKSQDVLIRDQQQEIESLKKRLENLEKFVMKKE